MDFCKSLDEHFADRAVITGPLTIPPAPDLPAGSAAESPTHSWSDVSRLCRQLSLLEERGDHAAAEELRAGPVAAAILALRTKTGVSDDTVARQFEATLATERERVANAAVLAELLAPMLERKLGAVRALEPAPDTLSVSRDTRGAKAPAAERPRSDNIADFIDDMLAYEQAARERAPARRAS